MNKPSRKELLIVRLSLVAVLVIGMGGYYLYKRMAIRPSFQVKFETTKGDFVVSFYSRWAPNGVARVKELVEAGFYDDCRFFRVLSGFVVQWGMNGDPNFNRRWMTDTIRDDPVIKSNRRGYVTFAKPETPHSRGTQLFVNLKDNLDLDEGSFAPVGLVAEGMDVVESFYAEYREDVNQDKIATAGNKYLDDIFPKLDYIKKATIIE